MKLSAEQERAMSAIKRWLDSNQQVFRLFGGAGTGKTSCATEFASGIEGQVYFCAFTGRAAHVLKSKGCEDATTIHKLIYTTKAKGQEKIRNLTQQLKKFQDLLKISEDQLQWHAKTRAIWQTLQKEVKNVNAPCFVKNEDSVIKDASVIIADECSMIDGVIGKDLESFGKKILVLGDPYQLPPVFGAGYFTNHKPDFLLNEIHRQALDNPIIAMATKIRNGDSLDYGTYGSSSVVRKVSAEQVVGADQVICGRNASRVTYNKRIRQLRGFKSEFPEVGDRLMCLRNNHHAGLLNGSIWKCLSSGSIDNGELPITIESDDDGSVQSVQAHASCFNNPKPNEAAPWEVDGAESFEYGYAATCHKLQGSEFPKVLVFDQSYCFPEPKRWLYTAATRAMHSVDIVKE